MVERGGGGFIVNIFSVAFIRVLDEYIVYCISKFVVDFIIRVMVLEFGKYKVFFYK